MGNSVISRFDETSFVVLCNGLAEKDRHLRQIIDTYSYPPLYKRKHGFETLLHIILEQQVSLASAKAALDKLKEKTGRISPQKILALTDEELKACYFSRQKIVYARQLAAAVISKKLRFQHLTEADDETVRRELKKIKGIGDWTADVYLMLVLQRTDLFPLGDIALINAIKDVKSLPQHTSAIEILAIASQWKPYRTIAAFLLWHHYLNKRKRK